MIRSIFSLGLGRVLGTLSGAVLLVLLPSTLGDTNLGRLSFAIALTNLTSLLVNLGTATFLTKEVARDRSQAALLIGNALITRIPLSLAATALTVLVVHLAVPDHTARRLVYVLCVWILFNSIQAIFQAAIQGLQRMTPTAAREALANTVYTMGVAGSSFRRGDLMMVTLAYCAGQAASLVMFMVVLLRHLRPTFRLNLAVCRYLLLGGLPFFTLQAAIVIYGQLDTVLLSLLARNEAVGWYAAAYRFAALPLLLPVILITATFPALSSAGRRSELFNEIARRALRAALIASVPLAIGEMFLAGQLLPLLRYPAGFGHSIPVIRLLALGLPLVAADMIIGTVLTASDQQRQWATVAVLAAGLNALLNLVAIPATQSYLGNGAIGAAAVTSGTEVFIMANGLRLLPPGLLDAATARRVLGGLAAAGLMAAVVFLLRHLPLLVPAVGGGLAYGAASIMLGGVTVDELGAIWRHVIHRGAVVDSPWHEPERR